MQLLQVAVKLQQVLLWLEEAEEGAGVQVEEGEGVQVEGEAGVEVGGEAGVGMGISLREKCLLDRAPDLVTLTEIKFTPDGLFVFWWHLVLLEGGDENLCTR